MKLKENINLKVKCQAKIAYVIQTTKILLLLVRFCPAIRKRAAFPALHFRPGGQPVGCC